MGPIALSVVFFINFAGQESLLCHSSDDLIEIIEHSTPFCSFLGIKNNYFYYSQIEHIYYSAATGAVSIFTVITSNFWWLFHTISVFWKVWFPFHARQFDISGHTKYLHIATLIIAPIFSTIPVGVAFGTGGFVINSLIPGFRNCVNRSSESYFYLFILPICVIVAIGTTLILLTMWKMRLHLGKQV